MKSKNKNAGKKMFHIILDKLESTPDEIEMGWYDYPSLSDTGWVP
jgi:hypothetical protein